GISEVVPSLVATDVNRSALFKILFLFLQRRRLVRNFSALNNALPCGAGPICSYEFGVQPGLCLVVCQIPICSYKCLPYSIQVRMAICQAWSAVSRCLRCGPQLRPD